MAGLEVRSTVKFNPSLIWLLLAVRPPWRRTAREREDAGVGRPSGSTLGDAKAEAVAALAALALSADPAGSFDVLFALLFRVVWFRDHSLAGCAPRCAEGRTSISVASATTVNEPCLVAARLVGGWPKARLQPHMHTQLLDTPERLNAWRCAARMQGFHHDLISRQLTCLPHADFDFLLVFKL